MLRIEADERETAKRKAEAEDALRRNEERLRLALMAANQGLYDLNVQTGDAVVNDEYARMLGYDPSEFVETNQRWIDRLHPDDREKVAAVYRDYIAGRMPDYRVEFRQQTKSGGWIWILSLGKIVERDAEGKPLRMLGTHTDITERKRIEDELREKERALVEAQRLGKYGNWAFDISSGRVAWSEGLYDIFEVDPSGSCLTYEDFVARVCPDDHRIVAEANRQARHEGISFDIVYRIVGRSGDLKYIREIGRADRDEEGRIVRLVGTAQDITASKLADEARERLNEALERKVAERTQKLSEANERLKEMDRLKSMFIASMSHELRTPLNSVIGFSSILMNEWLGPVSGDQKEKLSTILKAGRQLLAAINDIIDVSKIEAGTLDVTHSDFDLADLLNEAVESVNEEASARKLNIDLQPGHRSMRTDRRRLLQCLVNLLGNAVKFTPRGTVSLSVSSEGAPGMVSITVRDTGIGIQEEDLPRLFQAFCRLDAAQRGSTAGAGLGLYLTRKLVNDVLKGDITVESVFNRGSAFTIRIPENLEAVPAS